jgi:hypothetical protein
VPYSRAQVVPRAIERRQSYLLELEIQVSGTQRYHLMLLLRPSLGAVGVALDPMCLLRVRCADPCWFVRRDHPDPPPDGTLVVGGDMDPDLLKLTDIWRCGSSRAARSSTFLVDLLPQRAAAEGMSRALVIGAWYVERIALGARLSLEVAR